MIDHIPDIKAAGPQSGDNGRQETPKVGEYYGVRPLFKTGDKNTFLSEEKFRPIDKRSLDFDRELVHTNNLNKLNEKRL